MYRLELAVLETGGSYIKNLDTTQRGFSMSNPVFSFSYKAISYNDITSTYTYVNTSGVLTVLTAGQKLEVYNWAVKLTASDPWSPTQTAPSSLELPPRTWAQLQAVSTSYLIEGTSCYVTDLSARLMWRGTVWTTLTPVVGNWSLVSSLTTLGIGSEASVSDCGNAVAVYGPTGWTFRPIIINSNVKVTLTGTSTKTSLAQVVVPAHVLGNNGTVLVDVDFSCTGSTNIKNLYAELGTVDLMGGYAVSSATAIAARRSAKGRSRTKSTVWGVPLWSFDGTATSFSPQAVDLTVAKTLNISGKLSLSTETFNLEGFSINIQPAM